MTAQRDPVHLCPADLAGHHCGHGRALRVQDRLVDVKILGGRSPGESAATEVGAIALVDAADVKGHAIACSELPVCALGRAAGSARKSRETDIGDEGAVLCAETLELVVDLAVHLELGDAGPQPGQGIFERLPGDLAGAAQQRQLGLLLDHAQRGDDLRCQGELPFGKQPAECQGRLRPGVVVERNRQVVKVEATEQLSQDRGRIL